MVLLGMTPAESCVGASVCRSSKALAVGAGDEVGARVGGSVSWGVVGSTLGSGETDGIMVGLDVVGDGVATGAVVPVARAVG